MARPLDSRKVLSRSAPDVGVYVPSATHTSTTAEQVSPTTTSPATTPVPTTTSPAVTSTAEASDPTDLVLALVDDLIAADSFSGVVPVAEGDEVIWTREAGMADMRTQTPNSHGGAQRLTKVDEGRRRELVFQECHSRPRIPGQNLLGRVTWIPSVSAIVRE